MTSFITAIGTANPANKFAQRDIVRFMSHACRRVNGSEVKMEALYRATGIRHRYTVLDDYGKTAGTFNFFPNNDLLEPFPGTRQRMAVYQNEAKKLAMDAIHPGGKKILESVETELGIPKEKNRHAYAVLKNYGNMSSPTILFVLREIMSDLTSGNHNEDVFCMAFGPGITLESMMLKIVAS